MTKIFLIITIAIVLIACKKESTIDYRIKSSKFVTFNTNLEISDLKIINKLKEYQENNKKHGTIPINRIEHFFITNISQESVSVTINSSTFFSSPICYCNYNSNSYFIHIGYKYLKNKKDTLFLKEILNKIRPKERKSINEREKNISEDLVFTFEFKVENDTAYWLGLPKENPIETRLNRVSLIDSVTKTIRIQKNEDSKISD